MKKNILIIILSFATFSVLSAQGNLQFNQVLNLSFTTPASITSYTVNDLGNIVVPPGKVLKIESASVTTIGTRIFLASGNATIGDQLIWGSTGTSNYTTNNFPLWLSEGTYAVRYMSTVNSTYIFSTNLSGIEFNIIP